ncbi:hypothetical protein JCM4814A_67650 [Streptomyces phaeofaciens JCM 4814]|uniref:Uncharacterized protein n=1 Tax=Streptomyces phaeofaciens TaxID=68254 RepID=A0A918LR73_9ACTN|nr:hypothetical protein [Streptomyces phaeofaciens]GGT40685.1 hypothetical protein GCM10010226_16300 [Streptomyces phaeofaciens]
MNGVLLYARSRALPVTLAALAGTTAFAVWAADRMDTYLDPHRKLPLVALAPLLAAAVIGGSLHTASDELDRTAVRPWWPRRQAQLLGLTALAAALLPLAVLGDTPGFGPPAMIRNLLGCTGITAAAAAVLGARLSWLPAFGYVTAVYLASGGVRGRAVTVWAWPMQPGHEAGAWAAAGGAFLLGTVLYVVRGARPEGPRG